MAETEVLCSDRSCEVDERLMGERMSPDPKQPSGYAIRDPVTDTVRDAGELFRLSWMRKLVRLFRWRFPKLRLNAG